MHELTMSWQALSRGGVMVYPLLALGAFATLIIFDRAVAFYRCLRLPAPLLGLVETFGFAWSELERQLNELGMRNAYGRFFRAISDNRHQPAWWVESRAGDEAGEIEKVLNRGLWLLETIVTAAPLMGLLGTILGMMEAFKAVGGASPVAPVEVTSGVAEALISTALGLLIALFALFAFNFFSRRQTHALDVMERLGSRLVDHIRLDQEHGDHVETPALTREFAPARGAR